MKNPLSSIQGFVLWNLVHNMEPEGEVPGEQQIQTEIPWIHDSLEIVSEDSGVYLCERKLLSRNFALAGIPRAQCRIDMKGKFWLLRMAGNDLTSRSGVWETRDNACLCRFQVPDRGKKIDRDLTDSSTPSHTSITRF